MSATVPGTQCQVMVNLYSVSILGNPNLCLHKQVLSLVQLVQATPYSMILPVFASLYLEKLTRCFPQSLVVSWQIFPLKICQCLPLCLAAAAGRFSLSRTILTAIFCFPARDLTLVCQGSVFCQETSVLIQFCNTV